VVADRQHGHLGLVDPPDQLHRHEDVGVAGEVDREAVLELEHEAGGLAQVRPVFRARRVVGVGQRDLDAVDVGRAALVRRVGHLVRKSLGGEPAAQLDERDDRRLELLPERNGVADVVAVAVGERDQVDAVGRLFGLGTLRVPGQPRVDIDALAARAVEPEARVPEPGEWNGHGA
jgi:hypothetical protein